MSLLRYNHVSVHFGGVKALEQVSFGVEQGTIHGIIGPNGSGKTTLLNVTSGLLKPTAGELVSATGENLVLGRTFQTPLLSEKMTAIENVMTGAYRRGKTGPVAAMFRSGLWGREEDETRKRAEIAMREAGFDGDVSAPTGTLSFASLKKLELARAILAQPELLVLDEPASGLSPAEVEQMAEWIRQARDRGVVSTVLVVEHNVDMIFALCERVTVLDKGVVVADGEPQEVRQSPAVRQAYLGRVETQEPRGVPERPAVEQEELLSVRDLTVGYGPVQILRSVSFDVRRGDALGLLGRNGAGKSTLLNSLFGNPKPSSGQVRFKDHSIRGKGAHRLVRQGMALVEQDRGVLATHTVRDNLLLSSFGRGQRKGAAAAVDEIFELFPSLADRANERASSLSGGERKMLAIGRAVMLQPDLLVLDEPSIGLAPVILDHLFDAFEVLRQRGVALLIAEQNVQWMQGLLDSVYVLENGEIALEDKLPANDLLGVVSTRFLK